MGLVVVEVECCVAQGDSWDGRSGMRSQLASAINNTGTRSALERGRGRVRVFDGREDELVC